MLITSKQRTEAILVFKNMLSGLFPVITVIAYANKLPPITTLAWSSFIASIFFAILLTIRKEWKVNIAKKHALKDIALAILIVGIGCQTLFFFSLNYTSPQNVTLLGLSEVVFSFLIIGVLTKKEPISSQHIIGAVMMLATAIYILLQNSVHFNIGDILVIIMTIFASIGNIFAKSALHKVSLSYLLFLRNTIGTIVFFIVAHYLEAPLSFELFILHMPYLLFSGLVFLGLLKVITMFGFKNTSVTHTSSFLALKPVFAFIFAWVLLQQAPTIVQLIALIPSFFGLYLLTSAKQKQTRYGHETSTR